MCITHNSMHKYCNINMKSSHRAEAHTHSTHRIYSCILHVCIHCVAHAHLRCFSMIAVLLFDSPAYFANSSTTEICSIQFGAKLSMRHQPAAFQHIASTEIFTPTKIHVHFVVSYAYVHAHTRNTYTHTQCTHAHTIAHTIHRMF